MLELVTCTNNQNKEYHYMYEIPHIATVTQIILA